MPKRSLDQNQIWKCGNKTFHMGRRPLLMGILNVTPDSFSDGGRFNQLDAALAQAEQLLKDGADILDVGGESTRPGARPVDVQTERSRIQPAIKEIIRRWPEAVISIDTHKAEIAKVAVEEGTLIVNDVGAGLWDSQMLEAVASSSVGYIAMHHQGKPQEMQINPTYQDVVAEVLAFWQEHLSACKECGIDLQRVVVDPGIGFGKRVEDNLNLLRACSKLREIGRPILWGISRKSFLKKALNIAEDDQDLATSIALSWLFERDSAPAIWRVHDVASARYILDWHYIIEK